MKYIYDFFLLKCKIIYISSELKIKNKKCFNFKWQKWKKFKINENTEGAAVHLIYWSCETINKFLLSNSIKMFLFNKFDTIFSWQIRNKIVSCMEQ